MANKHSKVSLPKKRTQTNPNSLANLKYIQKGEVRNPKGRPTGSKNRATIVREILEIVIKPDSPVLKNLESTIDPTDQAQVTTLQQLMVLGQAVAAIEGNAASFMALMDSAYGKVADKHELTGEDGEPIKIETVRVILPQIDTDDNSESSGG